MPYDVRSGGKGCALEVYKKTGADSEGPRVPGGCHDTREQAEAHKRALWAAETDAGGELAATGEMDVALGLGLFDTEIAEARQRVAGLLGTQEEAQPPSDGEGVLVPQPGEHLHAVMHRQGKSTGRRTFTNLQWREPPFAYHWQKGSSAHGGTPLTVAVGLVGRVVPVGDDLHAFAALDLDGADGREYARRLVGGWERWVSIGLDEQPYTMTEEWADEDGEDMPSEMRRMFGQQPDQTVIDGGTIGELTGTSIPAQADAEVEATPELASLLAGEPPTTMPATSVQPGDHCVYCAAPATTSQPSAVPGVDEVVCDAHRTQAAFPPGAKAPPIGKGGDRQTPEEACPDGQHWVDGKCVPIEEGEEASARTLLVDLAGDRVTVSAREPEIAWLEVRDGELWAGMGDAQDKPIEQQSPQQRQKGLRSGERYPMHNCNDVGKAVRAVGRAAGGEAGRDQVRRHIISKARSLGCSDRVPDNWTGGGKTGADAEPTLADEVEALTAAAYRIDVPDLPPAAWFDPPTDVEIPGAFCITDAGRVYGILAPLDTGHRAYAQSARRLTVPRGNVDYSRWMGGEALVKLSNGKAGRLAGVGPITMDCGHASRFRTDHDVAPAHYDNSCTVLAKARVGETPEGLPWVAGALEPGVTPVQLSRALACRMSGDWQPHPDRPGWDELIAVLLVPSPGFASTRTGPTLTRREGALVASSMPVVHVSVPEAAADMDRVAEFERLAVEGGSDEWALRARRFNRYAKAH